MYPPTSCVDADGDGAPVGPDCPSATDLDCDDTDPTINPYAPEVCGNAIDENCSGGADEGCPSCDGPRPCGLGECTGVQECTDEGGWTDCLPHVEPQPERCGDGRDEDCDGSIDEGCACTCATDADCPDGRRCVECACT